MNTIFASLIWERTPGKWVKLIRSYGEARKPLVLVFKIVAYLTKEVILCNQECQI